MDCHIQAQHRVATAEPNAGLGALGRGEVVWLLVDELVVEPELQLPRRR